MSTYRRLGKRLRPYLPNTSDQMALVSLNEPGGPPFNAYWPMRLTQIVGGKTWSISFTRFKTPHPIRHNSPLSPEQEAEARRRVGEALDL